MAATLALLAAVLVLAPGPVAAAPDDPSPTPEPTTTADSTGRKKQTDSTKSDRKQADPDDSADPDDATDPAQQRSQFESATVVSGLSMLVERPDERLVAERETTYTIAVNNTGRDTEELTIRVTVPPWMSEPAPLDGGRLADGFVDWPVTVAPGEVATMRLTGAYASPERDAPTRMAFTACALGPGEDEPIVCDTDITALQPADTRHRWWLVATMVLVTAVVAGVAGFLLRRRGWLPFRTPPEGSGQTPAG